MTALNHRPIIGILSQPPEDGPGKEYHYSMITADYVQWLHSAGCRVAPIRFDAPEEELRSLFNSVNGLFFQGGEDSLLPETHFYKAAAKLFQWAVEANDNRDYFPIMGVRQGFQLLCILASDDQSVMKKGEIDASNWTTPIQYCNDSTTTSRMLKAMPKDAVERLTTMATAQFLNSNGILPATFESHPKLSEFYNLLATTHDKKGKVFSAIVEGKKYPFYGLQFHPERNQFDWSPLEQTNHSIEAVSTMQQIANFFVNECRGNYHKFPNSKEEEKALIFQFAKLVEFTADYTGETSDYPEDQTYKFPLLRKEQE